MQSTIASAEEALKALLVDEALAGIQERLDKAGFHLGKLQHEKLEQLLWDRFLINLEIS